MPLLDLWILFDVELQCIQTPSLFSHFVMLQPYAKIVEIIFFPSSIYTQYPINTEIRIYLSIYGVLSVDWNNEKIISLLKNEFINKEKLKYHIDISIQTLYSVLSWSTFGTNYSLESSWVWCDKFCTPGFGDFLPFFFANPFKLRQVECRLSGDSHFQASPEMFL